MADKQQDSPRKPEHGYSFIEPVLNAVKDLPFALRFVIVFLLLLAVIILRGTVVQESLVPLLYVLAIGGIGSYVALEIMIRWLSRHRPIESPQEERIVETQSAEERQPPAANVVESAEELRARYCQQLVRVCNRLQLATIDLKAATQAEAAELELSKVFTSLDVIGSEPSEDREVKEQTTLNAAEARSYRMPSTAAVSRWDKLVLLGDPGSGKSTFANFLTLCLAGDGLGLPDINAAQLGDGWRLPRLLPVRVLLREFAAEGLVQGKSLWQFITEQLSAADLSAFAAVLQRQLQQSAGGLLILDGLDEVPEANRTREQLKDAVLAFCDRFRSCRVLVTARPYAYQNEAWRLPGFEVKRLADFSAEQVALFIDKWYRHLAAKDPALGTADALRYAEQLKGAVEENPRLAELATRPLLLTLMASLHRQRGGGALPEKRQELYERSVELLIDLWQKPKTLFNAQGRVVGKEYDVFHELGISPDNLRRALQRVAYEVHREQPVLQGAADIPAGKLVGALYEASERKDEFQPPRVLHYLTDRAGVLIERTPEEQYAFPHRTFQEYLAACHLTDDFPYTLLDRVREDDERWREVVLLAAAKAASGTTSSIWTLVSVFCNADHQADGPPTDSDWCSVLRAAQALLETEQQKQIPARQRPTFELLRTKIERLCVTGALAPPDRAAAGRALAVLGDRRAGVGLRAGAPGIPDILWCNLPGGTLMMGSSRDDKQARENEYGPDGKPFPVSLTAFRLSAYPVTNAQFRPFVEGDGYQNDEYWTKAGWSWRESNKRTEPDYWQHRSWNLDNHPVVTVTWYEAAAWCKWLTCRLRETGELGPEQAIRLPTEAEWEWAARGPDAHVYPWANDWIEGACNSNEVGIEQACAVGIFPSGVRGWPLASDQSIYDLSGNVWEWCSTKWRDSYDQEPDDSLEGDAPRALRGGSFYNGKDRVRCASRLRLHPVLRDVYGGFRCAQ